MIISASRRTDIPAFYAEWFMQRIRAGFCTVPNPFNAGQVSTVSLAPEDVDAIVFWTRFPRPLLPHLGELDDRGYRYYFQFTLLGYPRALETHRPDVGRTVVAFRDLAAHTGPERVIWRYDPILLSAELDATYHRRRFRELASALAGSTQRCVISLVDLYAKARRRLEQPGHPPLVDKETWVHDPAFEDLMRSLADIAQRYGMEITSCAETVDLRPCGIRPGKCVDDDLLHQLFGLDILAKKDPSQRPQCGCVVSKDIGQYNTCLFGCQYCYATSSFDAARRRYARHDPSASCLGAEREDAVPETQTFARNVASATGNFNRL